jgi:signal transduction histidine kinase
MDNGPGISAELKDKIFAPFFSTKDGGTGLGLSISKKIIESYGGTLTLTDSGPEGSCFTVFLPGQYSSAKVN